MSEEWDEKLELLDQQIKMGHLASARTQLLQIPKGSVPRAVVARVGLLMVRSNLAHKAAAILNPVVRTENELRAEASEQERLALALALARLGSTREATVVLESLPKESAQAQLYLAYIRQTKWDYVGAIPLIQNYLTLSSDPEYERAVAMVNLLACLINAQQIDSAQLLLAELSESAKKQSWALIQKHLIELEAQIHIARADWSKAIQVLRPARESIGEITNVNELLLMKWWSYVQSMQSNHPSDLREIVAIRHRAVEMSHWETIRDCDRMIAELSRRQDLFDRVYVGSPFQPFRMKLNRHFKTWARPPEGFTMGQPDGTVLDLSSGLLNQRSPLLKPGQILHRALSLLFMDFYRPISVGHFFAELYPNQYFNPEVSLDRINMVLYRLRGWAKENRLSLSIKMENLNLSASVEEDLGIHVPLVSEKQAESNLLVNGNLTRLRSAVGDLGFTSSRAAEVLGVSKATVNRILGLAIKEGALDKCGSGRHITYKWVA